MLLIILQKQIVEYEFFKNLKVHQIDHYVPIVGQRLRRTVTFYLINKSLYYLKTSDKY